MILNERQNSPVPVVVVRHPDKRQKKMNKRKNNPNRKGYATILDKSASIPGSEHTIMKGGKIIEAEAGEAEAVAKALGLTSNLASWKGFGFRRDGGEILTLSEGNIAPSVKDDKSEQSAAKNDKEEDKEGNGEDEEDDEDEDEDGEDEENSGRESPTGVMYAESGGIENMPNYVGGGEDDLDEDVERLALSDEDDRKAQIQEKA